MEFQNPYGIIRQINNNRKFGMNQNRGDLMAHNQICCSTTSSRSTKVTYITAFLTGILVSYQKNIKKMMKEIKNGTRVAADPQLRFPPSIAANMKRISAADK